MAKAQCGGLGPRVSDVRPEYLILGFILQGATHGYDIKRRFEASLGTLWRISESQLYSMLKRLEARGFVSCQPTQGEIAVPRRLLEITGAGRERFDEWLVRPTFCSPRVLRLEFLSRLYFAGSLRPDLTASIYETQLTEVEREMKAIARMRAGLPRGDSLSALGTDFRLNQLAAARSWLTTSVRFFLSKHLDGE